MLTPASLFLPVCLSMHLFTGDYCRAREVVLMEFVIVEFEETLSVHYNFD